MVRVTINIRVTGLDMWHNGRVLAQHAESQNKVRNVNSQGKDLSTNKLVLALPLSYTAPSLQNLSKVKR